MAAVAALTKLPGEHRLDSAPVERKQHNHISSQNCERNERTSRSDLDEVVAQLRSLQPLLIPNLKQPLLNPNLNLIPSAYSRTACAGSALKQLSHYHNNLSSPEKAVPLSEPCLTPSSEAAPPQLSQISRQSSHHPGKTSTSIAAANSITFTTARARRLKRPSPISAAVSLEMRKATTSQRTVAKRNEASAQGLSAAEKGNQVDTTSKNMREFGVQVWEVRKLFRISITDLYSGILGSAFEAEGIEDLNTQKSFASTAFPRQIWQHVKEGMATGRAALSTACHSTCVLPPSLCPVEPGIQQEQAHPREIIESIHRPTRSTRPSFRTTPPRTGAPRTRTGLVPTAIPESAKASISAYNLHSSSPLPFESNTARPAVKDKTLKAKNYQGCFSFSLAASDARLSRLWRKTKEEREEDARQGELGRWKGEKKKRLKAPTLNSQSSSHPVGRLQPSMPQTLQQRHLRLTARNDFEPPLHSSNWNMLLKANDLGSRAASLRKQEIPADSGHCCVASGVEADVDATAVEGALPTGLDTHVGTGITEAAGYAQGMMKGGVDVEDSAIMCEAGSHKKGEGQELGAQARYPDPSKRNSSISCTTSPSCSSGLNSASGDSLDHRVYTNIPTRSGVADTLPLVAPSPEATYPTPMPMADSAPTMQRNLYRKCAAGGRVGASMVVPGRGGEGTTMTRETNDPGDWVSPFELNPSTDEEKNRIASGQVGAATRYDDPDPPQSSVELALSQDPGLNDCWQKSYCLPLLSQLPPTSAVEVLETIVEKPTNSGGTANGTAHSAKPMADFSAHARHWISLLDLERALDVVVQHVLQIELYAGLRETERG
ncbi:hypothetical protein HDU93_000543 [Gonapodya sp. JEL0774]|nr:hypothetical protein HDU93_000543 [Gonapodya sp. JEL0774]